MEMWDNYEVFTWYGTIFVVLKVNIGLCFTTGNQGFGGGGAMVERQ